MDSMEKMQLSLKSQKHAGYGLSRLFSILTGKGIKKAEMGFRNPMLCPSELQARYSPQGNTKCFLGDPDKTKDVSDNTSLIKSFYVPLESAKSGCQPFHTSQCKTQRCGFGHGI